MTRDEYTKETYKSCIECGVKQWIHDDDHGMCGDCKAAWDELD